jgi:excisionase family DNA binding protein
VISGGAEGRTRAGKGTGPRVRPSARGPGKVVAVPKRKAPAELTDAPPILTVTEAARLLRVSETSLYEVIQRGQLPALRVGRRLRIARAEIERRLTETPSPLVKRPRGTAGDGQNADKKLRVAPGQDDGSGLDIR